MASNCRAHQCVLAPTVKQTHALVQLLAIQGELYNAALEERRGVWKWEKRSVTRFEQYRSLSGMSEQQPALMAFGVTVARGTLLRLDRAFQAFFRRVKAGENPGFPRFKSSPIGGASSRWPSGREFMAQSIGCRAIRCRSSCGTPSASASSTRCTTQSATSPTRRA